MVRTPRMLTHHSSISSSGTMAEPKTWVNTAVSSTSSDSSPGLGMLKVYFASVDTIVSRTVLSCRLKSDGLAQPTNIQFFGAVALTDTFLPTW